MSIFNQFTLERYREQTLSIISIVLWVVVLNYAITQSIPRGKYGVVFLGIALVIYMVDDTEDLINNFEYKNILTLILYTTSFIAVLVATVYFYQNFQELNVIRVGYALDLDYQMALLIFLPVLYLTYRAFGVPFASVVGVSLAYAYFGPYFPSIFQHSGFSGERMLQIIATDLGGVYGSLNELMAAWIALFLLYAGLMQAYGAFDLIFRISHKVSKHIRSGVAQSAVVASMLIGSVNGSGTANAGITGSITIPLMKDGGLSGETAGGIESVASTGGQILPPIMGAGAFLMAALIGMPYSDIILAALVPAAIFYISVAIAVHYATINNMETAEFDLDLKDRLEVKTRGEVVVEAIRFGIPFFVLIHTLVISQYTIITSALYTCFAMFIFGVGIPILQEPSFEMGYKQILDTLEGLKIGASITASIAIIVAAINAIVDLLLATGIPSSLAVTLASLSGGVLAIALVISMVVCIIMGLGMPTSAAYLVVALLVVPALVEQFGIPELAAHFFVFYAAILATITPPIATGVAVASGIAEASFWGTAKEALKIGAPLFLLPFMFVYHPEIVTPSVNVHTLISGLIGLGGSIAVVYGFNNPKTEVSLGYLNSFLYILLGVIAMIHPSILWRLTTLAILTIYYSMIDSKVLEFQSSYTLNPLERIK